MNLREDLETRGFLNQFTDEKLFDLYTKGGQSFYIGFDPSADSLQLGNMCGIMAAVHLMKYGNKCYFLVGGATGMIGDPSGKDAERNFLTEEKLRSNEAKIYGQFKTFLARLKDEFGINFEFEMVNNYDFYKDMNYLKFLGGVGKYITVNYMAAKESVKKRLVDPELSISYAEFSYMLIQGYDFAYLYKNHGIKLQLGGSDQRGNVTTGIEIIRKKYDQEAYGLTIPLITDATGKKFGKSEGNAIWLDPSKNSPYFVYQYFMNTTDQDVEKYLKVLTLLDFDTIAEIVAKHQENLGIRYGQKRLAAEVVAVIFGKDAVSQAEKISEVLFGTDDKIEIITSMTQEDIDALIQEVGSIPAPAELKVLDLFTQSGLTASNGEAKKMMQQGSLYVNETKAEDTQKTFTDTDFVNGILLLRKGKKSFKVVKK
ncbi:MAG: tyrosine--tRNA ligase [Candidatus Absconditabacteria bacterium]|nr:tyrosine--tRNA ligase [Candidatus Absconditabacteria bacterium]